MLPYIHLIWSLGDMYVGSVGLSCYSSPPVAPRGFAWAQAWQLSTWAAVLPSSEW